MVYDVDPSTGHIEQENIIIKESVENSKFCPQAMEEITISALKCLTCYESAYWP